MPSTQRAFLGTCDPSLDQELEALQHVVAVARRNSWHGGDVVEPGFEDVLAAVTASSLSGISAWGSGVSVESHLANWSRPNSWREVRFVGG